MIRFSSYSRVTVSLFRMLRLLGVEIWGSVLKGKFGILMTILRHFTNGFDKADIEVLTAEKGLRNASSSDKLFKQKVVSGSRIVVAISFKTFFGEDVVVA